MISPQFGIFAQGTHAHYFLEFDLRPGISRERAIESFRRLSGPDVSSGGVNIVIAFRGELWREVAPSFAPRQTQPLSAIPGPDGVPSTPHDAWMWISGSAPDVTWQHARAAALVVDDVALLAFEQAAFTYLDSRDMTGFIDGTMNPPTRRAAAVAIIPPGEAGEGGSHVIAMRWVHDLDAFNRLTVADQERVFGRTKIESIELSDAEKPTTAHIERVTVESDGVELEIFRRSVPYGTIGEHGLYFVAFSADPSRYDLMLARMFGRSGDGLRDRLTEFSRPVRAAYYFAPSYNALNEVAGPEEE
jgi:putative iron-dependent peroxidase